MQIRIFSTVRKANKCIVIFAKGTLRSVEVLKFDIIICIGIIPNVEIIS